MSVSRSAWRTAPASSGGRRNVLSSTAMPPMRVMASSAVTKSGPWGNRTPTRVPLPTPAFSSRLANRRECSSADWKVNRLSCVTT